MQWCRDIVAPGAPVLQLLPAILLSPGLRSPLLRSARHPVARLSFLAPLLYFTNRHRGNNLPLCLKIWT